MIDVTPREGLVRFMNVRAPPAALYCPGHPPPVAAREREFFIDNLLIRIHLIIEMI